MDKEAAYLNVEITVPNNARQQQLEQFTCAGLALVPIQPKYGKPSKAPLTTGWNMPRTPKNPNGYSSNPDDFLGYDNDFNFGLYHGASNTLALDLDDVALAQKVFEELTDIQLLDWLESEERAEVRSPKANHGKLLFTLRPDFANADLRQLKHNNKTIFELRSGNCQDVIFGRHPEGGNYQFIGNPTAIPEAPAVLLNMLEHWDDWKHCFDSALGNETEPPKIAKGLPQQGKQLPGMRDPIREFNQSWSVADILIRNGYKPKGRDRFIRPGSESKAPGVRIMRNCADGIERAFSHGSDILNDSYAHDAFDCFCLLECGGDYAKALNWNPEITKHNQRLFMQEQARIAPESLSGNSDGQGQADRHRVEWQPFPFIRAYDLTAKPVTIDWLVEHIIERCSLNLLFGEPGAGKSLFALDWAFCLAAGIDWHGFRTKPIDVVVIAGEGFAGMARRLKALESKYQMKSPVGLMISERPAQLLDETNVQWVADTVKKLCQNPGLVIVDTLHRNMDGDENSSQDIAKFIANLDIFFKPLGVAVLVVHHSGHGDKQRSRGSSSIRAAMDGEFSATKEGNAIMLTCHKAKDFEAFKPLQFSLKPVDLEWCDQDGEPLTSVCLEYDGEAKLLSKKRKLSARDDSILTSLVEAVDAQGIEPSSEIKAKFSGFDSYVGRLKKVVHLDYWRDKALPVIDAETSEAKQKAFKRARDKLFELGRVANWDGYWWPLYD